MTYFVRVGPFRENASGVGARGYHIFRRGNKVVVRWGAIEVKPGARFLWRYVKEKLCRFGSTNAAKVWLANELNRRSERRDYSPLPTGQKIRGA